MMKKIVLRLRIEFLFLWILPAMLAVLYETGVFDSGIYAGDSEKEYLINTLGVLFTFLSVFLALKMFSFRFVQERLANENESLRKKAFVRWSEVRLSLLLAATLVNLSSYYITMTNSGVLCTLVLLLASMFCWPMEDNKALEPDANEKE